MQMWQQQLYQQQMVQQAVAQQMQQQPQEQPQEQPPVKKKPRRMVSEAVPAADTPKEVAPAAEAPKEEVRWRNARLRAAADVPKTEEDGGRMEVDGGRAVDLIREVLVSQGKEDLVRDLREETIDRVKEQALAQLQKKHAVPATPTAAPFGFVEEAASATPVFRGAPPPKSALVSPQPQTPGCPVWLPVPGGEQMPKTPGVVAPGAPVRAPPTPPWRLSGFLENPPGLQQYALVSMFSFCFFVFRFLIFF